MLGLWQRISLNSVSAAFPRQVVVTVIQPRVHATGSSHVKQTSLQNSCRIKAVLVDFGACVTTLRVFLYCYGNLATRVLLYSVSINFV